jgi:hypothetical protein
VKLDGLVISAPHFEVPGAFAEVKGSYGFTCQKLDFIGDVRLQAHLSETMPGAKGVPLKPVDPILARHHAGTCRLI